MAETLVILGAGQAAAQAIASARGAGLAGRIILVGDEPHAPYQRPPLSKKYLASEWGLDRVLLKPDAFYSEMAVELRLGTRAEAIDRSAARVRLAGGEVLPYDKLLIATGARPRPLPVPGANLQGVHLFRTLGDVDAIRPALKTGVRLAVIGGGYIGLEVAAVARGLGLAVTVIEMTERCLSRVVAPEVSAFFEGVHRAAGVEIFAGERVSACEGGKRLERIVCASGRAIDADIAVVGIGIVPNVELAAAAGLACADGITVDEFALTSDSAIAAAGDCANFPSTLYGRRVRLESVQNAIEQAKVAAASLLGARKPYNEVPWFWSDQYDLKLQIAGLSQGYDRVAIRGQPAARKFAAFYLREGRLLAVDAVNAPAEYMTSLKALIPAKAKVPPERLADTSVSMKEIAATVPPS